MAASDALTRAEIEAKLDVLLETEFTFHQVGAVARALCRLLWLADALVLTLPWALLWPRDEVSVRAVCVRMTAAIVVFTVLPLGWLAQLSPLLAAGLLYPGWSWLGIACVMALFCLFATAGHALHLGSVAWMRRAMLVAAIGTNVVFHPPPTPSGWVAIDTQFGRFPTDPQAAFRRYLGIFRGGSR